MTENIAREFRSRSRRTSRIIRPWIIVTAAAFLTIAVVIVRPFWFSELWRWSVIYGGFLVGAVAIIRINLVVNRHYRCPACNRVPMGRKGVLLNPDACPNCGASFLV